MCYTSAITYFCLLFGLSSCFFLYSSILSSLVRCLFFFSSPLVSVFSLCLGIRVVRIFPFNSSFICLFFDIYLLTHNGLFFSFFILCVSVWMCLVFLLLPHTFDLICMNPAAARWKAYAYIHILITQHQRNLQNHHHHLLFVVVVVRLFFLILSEYCRITKKIYEKIKKNPPLSYGERDREKGWEHYLCIAFNTSIKKIVL